MNKKEYKQENKKIKKEYKNTKKNLKEQYKKEIIQIKNKFSQNKTIKYQKKNVVNPPQRPLLEEIGNAVTHGIGSIFSIIAFILMLSLSNNNIKIISSIMYFIGLFTMFTMSCLYHSFKYGTTVKRLFRRFDYSSIYLLIGATFIPILLIYIGGTYGIIFLIIQWIIIITGVTFIAIFGPHKLRSLHITLYVTLGWSGLLLLPNMIKNNIQLFYYILGGGIIYTLGIIPFALKKKASHFIWHFFVLLGAIVQFIGIYNCIYK